MPNMFFISDHHFGHGNIIKYCKRGFANVHQMNSYYIDVWNKQVSRDDVVYHLGDFTFRDPTKYLSRLHGRIKIVPGNHDTWCKKQKFENLRSMYWPVEILPLVHVVSVGKTKSSPTIVLCHYPMYSWPHAHHGSWHLHGHSHRSLGYSDGAMHVGVDDSGGSLYSLRSIKDFFIK
jgi:calcineurin-like phosphoesterase family protein